MRTQRYIVLSALCLLMTSLSFGETTGAAFLKLGDGARPLALGGAFTAVSGGVDSMYYNPGALAWQQNPELSVTHSEWLGNTDFDLLSFAHPTAAGTLGVSALRLGGGPLEGRDANRLPTGDFTAEDIALMLSYSHSITSYAGLGVNAKFLRSRIESETASSVALDAGLSGRLPGHTVSVGASVLNVGSGLRFEDQVDRLPLTIALGTAFKPFRPFSLSADYVHIPYDQRSELRLGGEYSLSVFDFRLGYVQLLQGQGEKTLSAAEHLRGGFGIRWARYRVDYTLAPFGDLGLTQRFTLTIRLGKPAEVNLNETSLQP